MMEICYLYTASHCHMHSSTWSEEVSDRGDDLEALGTRSDRKEQVLNQKHRGSGEHKTNSGIIKFS